MHELNEKMKRVPMPPRMRKLPISPSGFVVPWFVGSIDGEPDFRCIEAGKIGAAVRQRLCWICGERLGTRLAFVIGPMCAITRCISEPPSHRDCAIFSAKACPFLSQPRMRRNEKDLPPEHKQAAGFGLSRNPGAACVWITRSYETFRAQRGQPGVLFRLGEAEETLWFCEGREATRAEVEESVRSGLDLLPASEAKLLTAKQIEAATLLWAGLR